MIKRSEVDSSALAGQGVTAENRTLSAFNTRPPYIVLASPLLNNHAPSTAPSFQGSDVPLTEI